MLSKYWIFPDAEPWTDDYKLQWEDWLSERREFVGKRCQGYIDDAIGALWSSDGWFWANLPVSFGGGVHNAHRFFYDSHSYVINGDGPTREKNRELWRQLMARILHEARHHALGHEYTDDEEEQARQHAEARKAEACVPHSEEY